MRFLIPLLALILIVNACSDDNQIVDPIIDTPELLDGHVVLQQPEIGQESFFVQYQAQCDDVANTFEFLADTIVLKVIDLNGILGFEETYTDYSITKVHNPDIEPVTYEIESIPGGLLLPDRLMSRLFYFYGNDTIRINRQHDVSLKQEDCLLMIGNEVFTGDETGHVDSFNVGPIEIEDKTVVSCVPMIDLDGYLMYTDNHMYVSHTMTTSEFGGSVTQWISGWKLLTDR